MIEYTRLIQKEKKEALQDYNEGTFRLRLDRKIADTKKPSRSYVHWFRKPAIAGSTVLLIFFLGWISTKFFLSSPLGSEEMHIKNTFVRLFSQHASLLNQIPTQIDTESEKSGIHEFQWSLKRVIFAIKRENVQDEDIAQDLSQVLQNTAVLIGAQKSKSDEWNI